jgi:hypothetical protein
MDFFLFNLAGSYPQKNSSRVEAWGAVSDWLAEESHHTAPVSVPGWLQQEVVLRLAPGYTTSTPALVAA